MAKQRVMNELGVMFDMAGCPNRCRHCWLGCHRNGNATLDDFRAVARLFTDWQDEKGQGIETLSFSSWWREPDFHGEYQALWKLEQELSSPGKAMRYELLSSWRLVRDDAYAQWAATLEPRACQLTFFGMEKTTDWAIRRKGAFQEQLLATERLLDVGIAPRWQIFITKRCMHELSDFTRLMHSLRLHERCNALGLEFEFFIGGLAPEGNGFELESERPEYSDIAFIPADMISASKHGLDMLGKPEHELYAELVENTSPPNMEPPMHSIAINADYDVYPNIAEPTEWWRLGNLKKDGLHAVLRAYRDETIPGMRANRTIPIAELVRLYGNPHSQKLYDRDDLISRFMHQWGVDYMQSKT